MHQNFYCGLYKLNSKNILNIFQSQPNLQKVNFEKYIFLFPIIKEFWLLCTTIKNVMQQVVIMEAGSVIKDKKFLRSIKDYYIKQGNYRDLLLFTLGINTGMRLNELLDLNVGDVRGKNCIDLLDNTNVLVKKFPLNKEVRNLIKKVIADKSDEMPLFESSIGRRIERTTVYRNFKEVVRNIGLDNGITLASLRKTFGYHYYNSFGDLLFLQWLFNQKNAQETMNYIGVYEDLSSRFKVMNL